MITESLSPNLEPRDYFYCETCGEAFDCWRYESQEETGHEGHALRALTREAFRASTRERADSMYDHE